MDKMCVGVDIAKASFVVAIKIQDEYKVRSFSNDTEGWKHDNIRQDDNINKCLEYV